MIAVSGTHGSGKTTLIEDFLAAHPEYGHEPEPYEWLDDASAEPSAEDFYRQLELSVERLRSHGRGARVIAERSPVDFLAYLLALEDLRRSPRDCALRTAAVELAAEGLSHVDVLVILPLDGTIEIPESEDLELRDAMNERLVELITTDEYALFRNATPRVLEMQGSRSRRAELLQRAVSC